MSATVRPDRASAHASAEAFDLDAYFARIDYDGPRAPTRSALEGVTLRHVNAIPFENLNPLLRLPVRLDLGSLQQKLVHDGRGGYCYEHNLLLRAVLERLGFATTGLAARVLWNSAPGTALPRTHMVLRVDLEGAPHVVDVGFGGMTLTGVLALEPNVEQRTPHESFRLLRQGDEYVMQARLRDDWKALYAFDLQPQTLADYELTSWYLCHFPQSHFLINLVAARVDGDRRHALFNNALAEHGGDGSTRRVLLRSVEDLRAVLSEVFKVTLPAGPELNAVLSRYVGGAAGT